MATPIPAFASQFFSSLETVQVTGGTLQTLPATNYYYLVSNRASAGPGQSLLGQLQTMLAASLSATWTVELVKSGGLYRIQIAHNLGSSKTVTFSGNFAAILGFANASFSIPVSTFVLADYPSSLWWTPDMPVSLTGPMLFDPSQSYGVPESAGASQRAPDMTTAYVQNSVQWSAEYTFTMVQFLYKIRKQVGHANEDLETWWQQGPAAGRRFLLWRNRDNTVLTPYPGAGSASPYNYIEYAPQETLRGKFPALPSSEPNLVYWDVKLDCWVTENGEGPLAS